MSDQKKTERWLPCPVCDSRTHTKVYKDTVLVNFPLFCPKCKKETVVDVAQFKITTHLGDILQYMNDMRNATGFMYCMDRNTLKEMKEEI